MKITNFRKSKTYKLINKIIHLDYDFDKYSIEGDYTTLYDYYIDSIETLNDINKIKDIKFYVYDYLRDELDYGTQKGVKHNLKESLTCYSLWKSLYELLNIQLELKEGDKNAI